MHGSYAHVPQDIPFNRHLMTLNPHKYSKTSLKTPRITDCLPGTGGSPESSLRMQGLVSQLLLKLLK